MWYAIWYHLYNLKNVKTSTSIATFSKVAGFIIEKNMKIDEYTLKQEGNFLHWEEHVTL